MPVVAHRALAGSHDVEVDADPAQAGRAADQRRVAERLAAGSSSLSPVGHSSVATSTLGRPSRAGSAARRACPRPGPCGTRRSAGCAARSSGWGGNWDRFRHRPRATGHRRQRSGMDRRRQARRINSPTALIASGKYFGWRSTGLHKATTFILSTTRAWSLWHRCSMVPARCGLLAVRTPTYDGPVVVLGIDPGLACTGFRRGPGRGPARDRARPTAIFSTRPRADPAERLHRIHAGMAEVLALPHAPTRPRSSRSSSASTRVPILAVGKLVASPSPPAARRESHRPSTPRPRSSARSAAPDGPPRSRWGA